MQGTKLQNNQYIANFAEMPDNRLVYTNKVFINQEHFQILKRQYGSEPVYVQCKDFVYTLSGHDKITTGVVLNRKQREECKISKMEKICLQLFEVPPDFQILTISASVEPVKMPSSKIQIQEAEIEKQLKEQFLRFTMNEGQSFILDFQLEDQGSFPIIINVQEIKLMDLGTKKSPNQIQGKGMINYETQLLLTAVPNKNIQVKSLKMKTVSMFKGTSFNFEELGVGGLDSEITEIFRRAFASRLLPPAALEKLGIQHVKGMLLYGPPGTGKTLIARSLAKCLHAHEPKIINGPEVFNKYVGQTEQNIRDLFVQAESEFNEKGDESKLHVIIFDEIDAICRPRGTISSGTGVHDTVVNQLLSKIDGVNALNNILVIGMTNRKDMIDEAVLRPGRLEVHIEIGLPNEAGRVQIFNIHTKQLRTNNVLDRSVNIQKLAQSTKNFSGAEIEAVVKSAASYAFTREVDIHNLSKELNIDNIRVTSEDFEFALKEIHPQFGIDKDYIETCIRGGIIDYGQNFKYITERLYKMINQVQSSTKTPLLSVLLEGPSGVGKTALAAYVALSSGFPFIKLVSPENFIDYTENGKIREINKIFNDAYKSPLSIIVLDNLERLIEFVNLGPRFSNSILQALIVLIKKQPPKEDRRVLIIGTCTNSTLLEDLELSPAFQQTISIPKLQQEEMKSVIQQQYNVKPQELETIGNMLKPLPIKQLLLGCERAMQGQKHLTSQAITESFGFEQIQNY